MSHRGPDNAGIWISDDHKIGFGHRRLSIIDLSQNANQPMSNLDNSLMIVFNGEIYNHRQIKEELIQRGFRQWKTDHSDTEVILHAFEQWGIDCLQKFRGMFAIALWDAKKRELWLIRDRIGIKPLYYSVHHNRITFASEIKALLKDPDQTRIVNEESLYHYLSFLTVPAPHTMFKGIGKVPAGRWLKISEDGSIQENRYWNPLLQAQPLTDCSEEEIAQQIITELRASVALRKISDVPIGIFLSGGLDSSTNTALFAQDEKSTIKTFSIGYDGTYGSYKNELTYARAVAKKTGAQYHEKIITQKDLLDFLPQMIKLQDEPIADPVCVPLYYLAKLARENNVTVCQVGEGADELFWGYPEWKQTRSLQLYDDLPFPPWIFKKAGLECLRALGRNETWPYEWLRRSTLHQPIFWGGAEAFTETQKKNLLSEKLANQFASFSSWEALKPIRKDFEEKAWEKTPLQWMTYLDLNLRLPELLLMRVDKMTMGVSLEARVPFLDHKLIELALSIPESVKTKNNTLKYILKKAVRGIIPDEIIDRKKQGFNAPVREWFASTLGTYAQKEINQMNSQTNYFDHATLERLYRSSEGHKTWYLLNFALWWKEYIS